jgi:hypothetical protein
MLAAFTAMRRLEMFETAADDRLSTVNCRVCGTDLYMEHEQSVNDAAVIL